ncbi:MAG: HD-GYP domain-containing protein [bacterium]
MGLEGTEEENLKRFQQLSSGILDAFSKTIEIHDPYTMGHQHRVAQLATMIGNEMGLPYDKIEALHIAGSIHDIGKISIPAEILNKPAPLTETEFSVVKTHPDIAYNILNTIQLPWKIADIVVQHHEKSDGSGYPNGLTEETILPEAKIIAVADVVEAMTFSRSYRPKKSIEEAMDFLSQKVHTHFDPNVVVACQNIFVREQFHFNT